MEHQENVIEIFELEEAAKKPKVVFMDFPILNSTVPKKTATVF